jgi:hypothetical protein
MRNEWFLLTAMMLGGCESVLGVEPYAVVSGRDSEAGADASDVYDVADTQAATDSVTASDANRVDSPVSDSMDASRVDGSGDIGVTDTGTVTCQPGTYRVSPTSCAPCPSNEFSANPNQSSCDLWQACPAGWSITTAGTAMSNQVCTICPDGTYSNKANSPTCTTDSVTCSAGTYVTIPGPGASADRVCAACQSGYFTSTSNLTTCTQWMTCYNPQSCVSADGSPTADRQCGSCSNNWITANLNEPCATGCEPD